MKRLDALSVLVIVGTALFSWLEVPRLPDRVAIHFDAYGQPNGWAPPAFAAWAMPALALLLWAFLRVSPYLVRGKRREAARAAPLAATGLLTVGFMCILHVILLENALGAGLDILTVVACLMGVLFIGLGFIMLGTRPNPLVGIRTRWTLNSDDNWARTHKLASITFSAAGLIAIASPLAGPPTTVVILLLGIFSAAIVPTVYSYVLARRGV
jgi:uncharacterized membrane protein